MYLERMRRTKTMMTKNHHYSLARSGLPISDNSTFFVSCCGSGAKSGYRLKIGVSEATGSVWPKIAGTRGRPPQNIFRVTKN